MYSQKTVPSLAPRTNGPAARIELVSSNVSGHEVLKVDGTVPTSWTLDLATQIASSFALFALIMAGGLLSSTNLALG